MGVWDLGLRHPDVAGHGAHGHRDEFTSSWRRIGATPKSPAQASTNAMMVHLSGSVS